MIGINPIGFFNAFSISSSIFESVFSASLPKELIITAKTNDGIIMGLMHQSLKIYGVQFHPESVLSLNGYRILSSFLLDCGYKSLSEDKFQFLEKKLIGNI